MEHTLSTPTIQHIKELLAILEPYAEHWAEWSQSRDCFLSYQEIRIIQNYLLYRSHRLSSIEFNLSETEVADVLCSSKRRLCLDYQKYQRWLAKLSAKKS